MLSRSLKLSPAGSLKLWDSCSFFQRDTCVAAMVESYLTSSDPKDDTHPLHSSHPLSNAWQWELEDWRQLKDSDPTRVPFPPWVTRAFSSMGTLKVDLHLSACFHI